MNARTQSLLLSFLIAATVLLTALPAHATLWTSGLTGLIVGPGSYPLEGGVLKPFVSDGCSISPDGVWIFGSGKEWVQCCIRHDVAYWLGGTSEQKQAADHALEQCMTENDFPRLAKMYVRGVEIGGGAGTSRTYRWGYGWNYRRPYSPLAPSEIEQAETLYGKDLKDLHERVEKREIPIVDLPTHTDPSLTRLTKDEKNIYVYLQSALKEKDVLISFEESYFNFAERTYTLTLEKCSTGAVELSVMNKDESIRITSDPARCLKAP